MTTYWMRSFIFDNIGNAQLNTYLAHVIIGGMLPTIVFFVIVDPDSRDVAVIIGMILRVMPCYCLGNGIMSIASREFYTRIYWPERSRNKDIISSYKVH